MNDDGVFIDTNILVYAYDRTAGPKHLRARDLVLGLRERSRPPVVSVQVLQELFVNLLRKAVPVVDAVELVELHMAWEVIDNDKDLFRAGLRVQQRWQLSPWDAWIVAAAQRAGVSEIWTEDLNAGQVYDSVSVVNPLA